MAIGIPKNGINKGWFKKNQIISEEIKKKISHALKGKKKPPFTNEHRNNMSKSFMGRIPWNKGKKLSLEHRKKLSESHIGKSALQNRGNKSHWWKGGISGERIKIYNSLEYKLWRKAVFERDDYICVFCSNRGGRLEADHIKPFALFPELRFAIDNGRTLCIDCHRKTDTYGHKAIYYKNNKKL